MLSSFLKKLLFARQFCIIDGKIEVLGKRQVMLPGNVIQEMLAHNDASMQAAITKAVQKDFEDYAKRVGSGEEGLLKVMTDVFETFGLGRMEMVDLDSRKKKCIVRIRDLPVDGGKEAKAMTGLTSAVLTGAFSFLFEKEVSVKQANSQAKGGYDEFIIK